MDIKRWGEEVWEEKINFQNESGVIGGSRVSQKVMNKRTQKNILFLKKFFLNKLNKEGSILDCGMGPLADYSIFFAKEGYNVTGVDISKTTLKYAEKNIKKSGYKIKLVQDNLADFKNVVEKYDLVFCTGVFLHIPSYLALEVMKQFYNKTKNKGHCLIQFSIEKKKTIGQIFFDLYYQIGHIIKGMFTKTFDVNCSSYTRKEILEMIKLSGFKLKNFKESYYLLKKA